MKKICSLTIVTIIMLYSTVWAIDYPNYTEGSAGIDIDDNWGNAGNAGGADVTANGSYEIWGTESVEGEAEMFGAITGNTELGITTSNDFKRNESYGQIGLVGSVERLSGDIGTLEIGADVTLWNQSAISSHSAYADHETTANISRTTDGTYIGGEMDVFGTSYAQEKETDISVTRAAGFITQITGVNPDEAVASGNAYTSAEFVNDGLNANSETRTNVNMQMESGERVSGWGYSDARVWQDGNVTYGSAYANSGAEIGTIPEP